MYTINSIFLPNYQHYRKRFQIFVAKIIIFRITRLHVAITQHDACADLVIEPETRPEQFLKDLLCSSFFKFPLDVSWRLKICKISCGIV